MPVEYYINCSNCGNQKADWVRQVAPSGHKQIYRCDSCILEEETCDCGCGFAWRRDDWNNAVRECVGNIDTALEKRWA